MTYSGILYNYLKEKGSFTHKEAAIVTQGNCSYSILRDLKTLLAKENRFLTWEWETNPHTKKRYKRYTEQIA